MTKSELIDAVAARGELTKARAELVVNCVFDTIIAALLREEGVEIRGFGSVTVRPYKPYEGRNPRTGAPVDVPAKRLPFFKVGKELRELVNGSRHLAITGDEQPRRVLVREGARGDGRSAADGGRASTPPWSSLPKVESAATPSMSAPSTMGAGVKPSTGPASAPRTVPARSAASAARTHLTGGTLNGGTTAAKR